MKSIEVTRVPVEPAQVDQVRTMLASVGYSTLREVLAAHCIEEGTKFMDAALYETESAKEQAEHHRIKAQRFAAVLDVLDGLQQNEQDWYRITLETRR